ncbi:hypothetical protein J2X32_002464, partial [Rheinheimera pacifica]|nr:hypothetical protein [Rheinheimera pacifica]
MISLRREIEEINSKKAPRLRVRLIYLMRSLAVNYSRIANATLPS